MKDELRRNMREKLKTIAQPAYLPADCTDRIIELYNTAQKRRKLSRFKTLFTYLAFGHEIDTGRCVEEAFSQGHIVVAPRTLKDTLNFHRIKSLDGPFETGVFGIREPPADTDCLFPVSVVSQIQFPVLILVPGLAFTRSGARLGRGAGYYDRFLSSFLATFSARRDEILLAGCCHTFQVVEEFPTDPHDVPVDCLITERDCILSMSPINS